MPAGQIGNKVKSLALALAALAAGTAVQAAGTASGQFLQETFGGRPQAMGQAYAALADDIFGMVFNPAGLSRREEKAQAAFQYGPGIADNKSGFLGLAMPLSRSHALGLSLAVFDAGTIDVFDSQGNLNRSVSAESDQLIHLGYSYARRELPARLPGALHLGVGAKFLRSVLGEEVQAQTIAMDLGLLYVNDFSQKRRGSLGISIANIGPGLKYSGGKASGGVSDPLPRTVRTGLGYSQAVSRRDRMTVSFELDQVTGEDSAVAALGLEYLHHGLVALRLGYRRGDDLGSLSFGTGILWQNLSLDYSMGLSQTFGNLHKVSLGYSFNIPWVEPLKPPPTPLDKLSKEIEADIAAGRYFYAQDKVLKMIDLFPNEMAGHKYQDQISAWIAANIQSGMEQPRFHYAYGHQTYYHNDWEQSMDHLSSALRREPQNAEIREYLDIAKKKLQGIREEEKLKKAARISYLYDLAYKAYQAKDYDKSLKILTEILRIASYDPAIELMKTIKEAQRKKVPAALAPPPPPPPKRETAKAMELYYKAIRRYSEGDLEGTIEILKAARELDKENLDIQSTLTRAEQEWKEAHGKEKPKP